MLADSDLAPRPHQAFPIVGLGRKLMGQQDFDFPTQKIPCGRIPGTEPLRPEPTPPSVKPGRKHTSVIEYDQIVRPEQLGEFGKLRVTKPPGSPIQPQQP